MYSISYNTFHDQLVLSGGTDGLVNLHSVVSISSANIEPLAPNVFDDDEDDMVNEFGVPEDGIVQTYDHHEDSIYGVCWSCIDPWIFASLSFDGNVLLNRVPTEHKYKIIL
jgi:WD40 repeat protein